MVSSHGCCSGLCHWSVVVGTARAWHWRGTGPLGNRWHRAGTDMFRAGSGRGARKIKTTNKWSMGKIKKKVAAPQAPLQGGDGSKCEAAEEWCHQDGQTDSEYFALPVQHGYKTRAPHTDASCVYADAHRHGWCRQSGAIAIFCGADTNAPHNISPRITAVLPLAPRTSGATLQGETATRSATGPSVSLNPIVRPASGPRPVPVRVRLSQGVCICFYSSALDIQPTCTLFPQTSLCSNNKPYTLFLQPGARQAGGGAALFHPRARDGRRSQFVLHNAMLIAPASGKHRQGVCILFCRNRIRCGIDRRGNGNYTVFRAPRGLPAGADPTDRDAGRVFHHHGRQDTTDARGQGSGGSACACFFMQIPVHTPIAVRPGVRETGPGEGVTTARVPLAENLAFRRIPPCMHEFPAFLDDCPQRAHFLDPWSSALYANGRKRSSYDGKRHRTTANGRKRSANGRKRSQTITNGHKHLANAHKQAQTLEKRQQPTANDHKRSANDRKQPQTVGKRPQTFVAVCGRLPTVCGRLRSFADHLWPFAVVCGRLPTVCGRLLPFADRLWPFAAVCRPFVAVCGRLRPFADRLWPFAYAFSMDSH
eukprot:gene7336-biopygen4545